LLLFVHHIRLIKNPPTAAGSSWCLDRNTVLLATSVTIRQPRLAILM
jgi:hypothetical protein